MAGAQYFLSVRGEIDAWSVEVGLWVPPGDLLWIAAIFGLVGLFIGRWWSVGVPVVGWLGIAAFLVLNNGWYGHGWGDYGIRWNVVAAALSVAAAAVGVAIHRAARKTLGATLRTSRSQQ